VVLYLSLKEGLFYGLCYEADLYVIVTNYLTTYMTGQLLSDNRSRGLARKKKTTDLQLKTKIIKNSENDQTLTSLSREIDSATSAVQTIFKDRERTKKIT
jgi:hypothetical protein